MDRVARPDKAKKTKVFEAGTVRPLEDVLGFGQSEFVWYLSRLSKEDRRTLTEELKTKKGELEGKEKALNHEEQAWKKSVGTKIRYVDGFFREHDVSAEQEIPDGEKIAEALKRYPEIVSEEELDAAMPDRGSEALEALTMEVRDLQDVRSHISELWRRIESSEYVPDLRKGREKGAEEIEFGRYCKELDEKKKERDKYLHEFERIRNSLDRIQKALGGRINGQLNKARGGKDVSGALETLRAEQDEVIRMLNAVSFDRLEKRNGNKGGSESGETPAAESEIVEPGSVSSAGEAGLMVSSPEPEPESLPTDAPEPELANGLKPGVSREPALADPVVGPIPETQTLHAVVESGNIESGRSEEMARLDEAILKAEKELASAIEVRGEYLRRIDARREEVHARLEKARAVLIGARIDDVEHQVDAELGMTEEDEAYQEIIRAAEERLAELRAQREALSMVMPETEGTAVEPAEGDASRGYNVFNMPALQLHQEFGIGMTDLEEEVPEFGSLTRDQQLFAIEMLRNVAVRQLEDETRDTTKAGMTKGFRFEKTRKDLVKKMAFGGIGAYGEHLRQLVEGIRASGLDLEEKDGAFDVRFLTLSAGMMENESVRKECEAFNEVANRFSKIPQEWSYEGATKEQRKAYADERERFEEAARRAERAMFSSERGDDAKAYAGLTEEYGALRVAENRVRLVQHIRSHPEIGEYLNDIRKRSSLASFFRTTLAERGAYFAGGVAGRMAVGGAIGAMGVAGTLGLAAAPFVSVFTGGIMANRRAKEALSDQDRKARRSIENETGSSEGSEGGWLGNIIRNATRKSGKRLEAGKRVMVRAAAPTAEKQDSRKRGLAERLDIIQARIAGLSLEDFEARERELGFLLARVEYVKKKLDEDKVSFGDGAEGVRGRVRLLESLSRAELTLGLFTGSGSEAGESASARFERRFGELQQNEDERVKSARDAYVRHETLKGAVMSGTISLLGVGVMSAVQEASAALHHVPGSGSAKEHLDAFYGTKGVGMSEDGAPSAGTGSAAQPLAEAGVPGTGAAQRIANETGAGSRAPGAGVASEAIGQTPTRAGTAVPEAAPSGGRGVSEVAGSTPASLEGVVRSAGGVVTEARRGDGLTHLARRAFAEYTGRTPEFKGLSAEQKVFVEDYLSKKVGHAGTVAVGDKVEFTDAMMREAAAKARGLSASQVENLHAFSERVGEFRTGKSFSPEDFRQSGRAAAGIVDAQPVADPVGIGKGPTHSPVGGEVPSATERGGTASPELEVLRRGVSSADAREFLADPSNATAFRRAAQGSMETLFPVSGKPGSIDGKKLFDALGGRRSDTLLQDCLLVVARSERTRAGVLDVGIARRFGKFLIAAHRNGVLLKTEPGEQETLQAYIERFSVAMAKRGLDPAKQIALVTDEELNMRAGSAAKAWQESRGGA